jgi:hypothetical protein
METHSEIVPKADQAPLRVALDALTLCMVVGQGELRRVRSGGGKLFGSLRNLQRIAVAHTTVLP